MRDFLTRVGDPRISSVKIIWKRPEERVEECDAFKGEWVLEVISEKFAVKKSGDAWRVVVDSYLPVFHLIDTRRSIPWSMKQVQELLGIASTFEQIAQRLSASVRTVSKGILTQHILLLANNMPRSWNLQGFSALQGSDQVIGQQSNLRRSNSDSKYCGP
ncbi:unnamed protein product [Microthlaspi erraticum]|uniref:DNA-directed RNA polymerase n=1 Tax=Microthlaspi erraticum TaxID=1685480 RepID=A0A6D2IDW5_9BRAS|nr:unnamed protein product [Microthlaspi erraticum]CAA7025837.1 unnamed protein product [Microthlaspi erraticum]